MATIKQHWIKGISQNSSVGSIIDTVLHYNHITGIRPSSYNYPYYSINKLYNNNIQHMPYRRGFYSKWFTDIRAYISRMSGPSRIRTYDLWCCKHNALPTDPCIRHPLELEYTWFEALLNMTWPSLLKALYASVLTQQWSTQSPYRLVFGALPIHYHILLLAVIIPCGVPQLTLQMINYSIEQQRSMSEISNNHIYTSTYTQSSK